MSDAGLELSKASDAVALIEFARPERRNPIDAGVGAALIDALTQVEQDDTVRAVVLSGRGGTFSAGGDIDRIASLPSMPETEIVADFEKRFVASRTIWESPKAYIAAVSGPAVGAAFGLAMACDLRIGDDTAMFLAPFSNMGLVPDYGLSWLLPRSIGASAALEISLLGDRIGAAEAYRVGILNRLVDDPLAASLELAERIAARPSYGVAESKRLAHAAAERSFAEGLADEVACQAHGFHEPEVQQQVAAYTQSIGSRSTKSKAATKAGSDA